MQRFLKAVVVAALQWEARLVLRKYRPKIVAVTGSVGKTTAKDAIYAVLSTSQFVRKSEKSFNSEIGIPLTILGVPNAWSNPLKWAANFLEGLALILFKNHYPRWLVLEVGADRPRDIERVVRWLRPDIVVVTRIPDVPVHVEFFDSPESLEAEKGHLVRALGKDGILVLNADDPRVSRMRELFPGRTMTFGFGEGAAFKASHEEVLEEEGIPAGMTFRVDHEGSSVPLIIRGALGRQHVYPALAALAVGFVTGVNLVKAAGALEEYRPPVGRMKILNGIRGSVIIDDSYNASPVALHEAIEAVKFLQVKGKKIAILGDMLELGTFSAAEHRRAGVSAASVFDLLATVGIRARAMGEEAARVKKHLTVLSFHDSREAADALPKHVGEGDLVLVKGSQSIRLERVTARLLTEPERTKELLPRQDAEWLRR